MTPNPIGNQAAPVRPHAAGSPVRITDLLLAPAGRHPEATALVFGVDRIPVSYRELERLVDNLAGQLTRGGLQPGDRAGLRAHNSPEFVIGLLAAAQAGAIVVPLDPALPASEQDNRIAAAGARVVLVDDDGPGATGDSAFPCWPVSVTAGRDGGVAAVAVDTAAPLGPATSTPDGLGQDDTLIMFTGGTTGAPKMVPWTHENVSRSISDVVATYQLGPRDATVAVMPFYHGHGLIAALLSTLASGGRVLLPAGGRFSAHTFWDDVNAASATWFTAVPTIHQILLERAAAGPGPGRREGTGLRFIRSCSAALSPETAQALRTRFTVSVVSAYGMTEATHQVASTGLGSDDDSLLTPGLVGRSSGVEIRIVADGNGSCPPGAVGEVWVRGRTVVRGYLGDEAATAKTFADGWLHTGDLGSLSASGDLTLHGRIKELINRGGEKISPERVEAVLVSHPNVVEAAVFGTADPLYGETVAAVIVPSQPESVTPTELAEFCRESLVAFEVPARIQEASALPHTPKGSIDRRAVAEQFGGES